MPLVKKQQITQKEFQELSTEECIEISVCTKTRKCGWKGLEPQLMSKKIDEIESVHACPSCGNDEFYTEYRPKWLAIKDWVKQEKL